MPISQMERADISPDHPVAIRSESKIPFSQFYDDVAHNAARLRAKNCRTGALFCEDSYWFLVGFQALCHAGATIIIPSNTQPQSLKALSENCEKFVTDQISGDALNFLLESAETGQADAELFDSPQTEIFFFTSGSTAAPKKIRRTVQQLEQEVRMVSEVLPEIAAGTLVSATVPHHHVYGLIFRILWPFSSGHPFSATTHEVWETLLNEIEAGGAIITSPAHLSRLAGIDAIPPALTPGFILSAGAILPREAAYDASRVLGRWPTEIFGSTETGACAIRQAEIAEAPWQGLPGVKFDVTEDELLKIQSPAVADRHWVETADIVTLLSDEQFSFKGRADHIVKIEGKRVSLPEIESHLSQLSWVEAAATLIVETPRQQLGAVVICSVAGRKKLLEMGAFRFSRLLRRELSQMQEAAGLPRVWRFVESLPSNNMGKRSKEDLAALFTEGVLHGERQNHY